MRVILEGTVASYELRSRLGGGYSVTEIRHGVGASTAVFASFIQVVEWLLQRELEDDEICELLQIRKALRNLEREVRQLRETAQTSFDQC